MADCFLLSAYVDFHIVPKLKLTSLFKGIVSKSVTDDQRKKGTCHLDRTEKFIVLGDQTYKKSEK